MYYRHNLDYQYPERSDEHMITVKHLRDFNPDENYEYLPKGFWHKISRGLMWLAINLVGFPACTIRYGLKIHGREKLKKYKKEFKDGAITIANHVLMWDYLCVLKAIRPHIQYHPGWKINFEGPNGPLIRWVGGIPIPTGNVRAMGKFQKAIGEVLQQNKWYKRSLKVALGVDDANMDVMEEFTGSCESAIYLRDKSNLKKLIRIVSVTSSTVGSKKAGDAEDDARAAQEAVAEIVQDEMLNFDAESAEEW